MLSVRFSEFDSIVHTNGVRNNVTKCNSFWLKAVNFMVSVEIADELYA